MSLEPLKQWYCDVCGEVIEKPEDGYVVWKATEDTHLFYDFKIIHVGKCDDKTCHWSLAVEDFLGNEGNNRLLEFLGKGPKHDSDSPQRSQVLPKYYRKFMDFFERLQTPDYEEQRKERKDKWLEEQKKEREIRWRVLFGVADLDQP